MEEFERLLTETKVPQAKDLLPTGAKVSQVPTGAKVVQVKKENQMVPAEAKHAYWDDPKVAPVLYFFEDVLTIGSKTEEIALLRKEMFDFGVNPLGAENLSEDRLDDLKYFARGRLLLAVQKGFSEIQSLKGAPVRNEEFWTFVTNNSLRPRFLELCARIFAELKLDNKGIPYRTVALQKILTNQSLDWFLNAVPYKKVKDKYVLMEDDETTDEEIHWNLPPSSF